VTNLLRDYMLKAHEAGTVRATYNLGQMYINGNLVTKDETKGAALSFQAAEQR
jgi:TPR repeat protein